MAIEQGPQFYMRRLGGSVPTVDVAAVGAHGESISGSMARRLDVHGPHYRPEEKDTLFHSVKARPWIVTGLYSHPDMNVHVPTVLGALDEVASRTSSRGATPSYNLSAYSSKIVDRLASKGVVKGRDPKESLNNIARDEGTVFAELRANHVLTSGGTTPMSAAEVSHARDVGRRKLRGRPVESSETPTTDQGTLF